METVTAFNRSYIGPTVSLGISTTNRLLCCTSDAVDQFHSPYKWLRE